MLARCKDVETMNDWYTMTSGPDTGGWGDFGITADVKATLERHAHEDLWKTWKE
jgi:hypothetical protein